jgi:hypothetical protein
MKALYGIERLDRETGLWLPTDEALYERRQAAAYRMIELNSRVPMVGQMFRVTVLENAG